MLSSSSTATTTSSPSSLLFDKKIYIATAGLCPHIKTTLYSSKLSKDDALTIANYIISMK
jgi:hypothetical protein